ncbi:MAG: PQQ-dependent sugar dehydrogenase [Rhodothermaceae bacterium]|nr:PQQ-dependent sugar dehydrogenase [Rhodothermaceae bacterium]
MNPPILAVLSSYRLIPLFLTICLAGILIGTGTGINHADSGRDEPVAVGMFLDGAFPSLDPNTSLNWKIVDAFPNLSFHNPIYLLQEPGTDNLWVAEHAGKIYRFAKETDVTEGDRTEMLDITSQVKQDDASGIKSFAFHPEYGMAGSPNAHYVYLFYRYTPDPLYEEDKAFIRVSRFTVQEDGIIDPESEFVLIHQFSYSRWHDGGDLLFDNEGYLYISLGEDTDVNKSQLLNGPLFGGVLRIDVDMDSTRSHPIRRQPLNWGPLPDGWEDSFSQGYFIPNDNPWVNESGEYLEEFFAVGLRSPHRMTYDSLENQIWIGDVGEYKREEINILTKKANYGWPIWEGDVPGDKVGTTVLTEGDLTFPLYAYSHAEGQAIIGGHVYRGSAFAEDLEGKYIYADYNTRNVYALSTDGFSKEPTIEFLAKSPAGGLLGGIGKDAENELYFIRWGYYDQSNGRIYKLEKSEQQTVAPPALLSQTNAFKNLQALTPKEALIPYSVVNPLWSDGADKQRWFAVPNDGTHDLPQEQFTFSGEGNWDFPVGSVFVKQFDYKDKKIETRFLIRGDDGEWYGLTYKWREDQSDADLLEDGLTTTIEISEDESIEWQYPSNSECFRCHTDNSGVVLGFRTRQLNRDAFYPSTSLTANQISTYSTLGLLGPSFDDSQMDSVLTAASLDDEEAEVSFRVRSYLDSNCSHCHQPGGTAVALFDARLTTPLEEQNLINGPVVKPPVPGATLLTPGHPEHSVLYLRMNSLEEGVAMPPLAKKKLDPEALELLLEWISDPLLPVELINFQGIADGSSVILKWETVSEQNNYGFDVERRMGTSDFVRIGFIEGHGTTAEIQSYQFVDTPPPGDGELVYRLKQIDYDGQFEISSEIAVDLSTPAQAQLYDNYPDPFNPVTTIEYEVPIQDIVTLTLYDVLGREIRELVHETQAAGRYRISLDATDLPSGTYIYQLKTGEIALSKTMVLAK